MTWGETDFLLSSGTRATRRLRGFSGSDGTLKGVFIQKIQKKRKYLMKSSDIVASSYIVRALVDRTAVKCKIMKDEAKRK